jgi:hypothetical protein
VLEGGKRDREVVGVRRQSGARGVPLLDPAARLELARLHPGVQAQRLSRAQGHAPPDREPGVAAQIEDTLARERAAQDLHRGQAGVDFPHVLALAPVADPSAQGRRQSPHDRGHQ